MTKITVFSYNKLQAAFSIIIITTSIGSQSKRNTPNNVPCTEYRAPSTEYGAVFILKGQALWMN